MRLFRAELTRLFARRFTKIMLLVMVLALGVIGAVTASQTHPPTDAEISRARSEAADLRAECERAQLGTPAEDRSSCTYETEHFLPYVLEFRDAASPLLFVFFGLLTLFAFLVGASFVGAEWSSGGMTNLLLWRNQRLRVLFGKLTALSFGILLTGALLGGGWMASIWAIARFRGVFGDLTPGFWNSLALDGARGMGLALLAVLTGAALASLGRRTAAALGVLIGYLVVWEIGAMQVMRGLRVDPEPFMLSSYIAASVVKEYRIYFNREACYDHTCDSLMLTWQWGLAALGGVTVLTILAAAVSFRRRDIA
ncbi:MAG: ABC transporter permease subunit [Micromonosporaceae bacterium]